MERAKVGTASLDRVPKAMKKVGAASAVPLWEQKEGESAAGYGNLRDIAEAASEGATGLPMAITEHNIISNGQQQKPMPSQV